MTRRSLFAGLFVPFVKAPNSEIAIRSRWIKWKREEAQLKTLLPVSVQVPGLKLFRDIADSLASKLMNQDIQAITKIRIQVQYESKTRKQCKMFALFDRKH